MAQADGGARELTTVPGDAITVLVIDDSAVFREGMMALLETVERVAVVGEASDGSQGIERALELQPDVALMDLNMPGIGGVEATRALVSTSPHIAVLVLTMYENDESVFAAIQAGARGYLLKGARQDELLNAIRTVSDGGAVFGPSIARRLINYFTMAHEGARQAPFSELTPRESEILELVARGCSNTQIAEQLVLSPKTVRNHVSNVFAKLQVADRAAAIIKAREAGFR